MIPLMVALPLAGSSGVTSPAASNGDELLLYIGTYTTGASTSKGIYAARLNTKTGQLSAPELAAEMVSPSYLAASPTKPVLYAISETNNFGGQQGAGGGVAAFTMGKNGKLTKLNEEQSGGSGPAFVSVDNTGSRVYVANYGSGSVASFPVDSNGKLKPIASKIQHEGSSVNPTRQNKPHAHSINPDPGNTFAVATDLGLDKILVYRVDPKTAALVANDPPFAATKPGSGPRHLTFSPNGKFAYVADELASSVTVYSWDAAKGTLTEVQSISMLPEGFTGNNTAADIHVHPSGKFVYASNRGADSIVIYSADPQSGTLTLVGHESTQGKTPRNFSLDPTGGYLLAANQQSDSVVVFSIDKTTGKLTPTGATMHIAAPVCVRFAPRH